MLCSGPFCIALQYNTRTMTFSQFVNVWICQCFLGADYEYIECTMLSPQDVYGYVWVRGWIIDVGTVYNAMDMYFQCSLWCAEGLRS